MDAASDTAERIKILMLPWLAHGHVSPFLDLAKNLSLHNIKVYLCSTPVNLKPIRENSVVEDYPLIELVDLHLSSSLLPPHLHTTRNLPLHLNSTLKAAFDEAKPAFCNLLKALKPSLVIVDGFQLPWAVESANDLNLKSVIFSTPSAASTAFLLHFSTRPSSEFPLSYPENERKGVAYFLRIEANGMTNKERILKTVDKTSNLILIRTSREIEPKYIEYLSVLTNKEVVPVGTLTQARAWKDKLGRCDDSYIEEWLNQRDARSVVYVSFGSEYNLSKEEMGEMARGLELSKVSFIWAVRFPGGDDKGMTFHDWLPEGFLERVKKVGLVLQEWAPQAKILGHPSTGGFVSHCGWSSTLEGMASGVPFIAMPMQFDQPMNAMFIEEIGVGVVVPKRDGKIDGEQMAKVINEVLVGERGKLSMERAAEYSSKLKGTEEQDLAVKKLLQIATV